MLLYLARLFDLELCSTSQKSDFFLILNILNIHSQITSRVNINEVIWSELLLKHSWSEHVQTFVLWLYHQTRQSAPNHGTLTLLHSHSVRRDWDWLACVGVNYNFEFFFSPVVLNSCMLSPARENKLVVWELEACFCITEINYILKAFKLIRVILICIIWQYYCFIK